LKLVALVRSHGLEITTLEHSLLLLEMP